MARHESEMHRHRRELWQTLQATADWLHDAINFVDLDTAAEYREQLEKARDCLKRIKP
jgi:hypothetical protein